MRRPLALACALALAPLVLGLVGCTAPVQHGLEESAANEVLTALERGGIGAEKVRDEGAETTFVVRVSRGDASRAMELMRSLGLPRSHRSGMAEMYGQPSLVPSATEERARFLEALGNDIERTLETIDGVVSARVHIVLAETDPLAAEAKPRVPAQAAVLLKTRAGGAMPLKEEDVQRLVAGSVPGLQPASVAVVVTSAPEWAGASAPTMIALGPVRMTPGSRVVLLTVFGALLAVIVALAVLLLFTARRLFAAQAGTPTRTRA